MSSKLLTAAQVARQLNVDTKTVYAAAACGRLPCIRLWKGSRRSLIRFDPEQLEVFLRERRCPPQATG